MENDAERVTPAAMHTADSMLHVHAIVAARAAHRAVARGEDNRLALVSMHHLGFGLRPRLLFNQQERDVARLLGALLRPTEAPFTHAVFPVAPQAPTPHVVVVGPKSSSVRPLQLSSMPSHVASFAAGAPALHVSRSMPAEHDVTPAAAQAPTPQVVACGL